MATYTPNYNLGKPDDTDRYDLFRQLFNDNMDIIDDNLGSGGSGNLTAHELTQAEYNALTQAEKESETDVYFINDTVREEIETPVDITQWQNTTEQNMGISTQSGFLVYSWNSGSYIGAFSIYQVQIPADVKKIKYKLTTGTSYSNTIPRFRIGVGVKNINSTTPTPLPDTDYDNTWIKFVAHDEQNTTIEGELDLSDVTNACYLYFTAPGWNVTVDEMVLVTEQETSETVRKIMYRDVAYGSGSANIISLTQAEYDALPSSKESDNVLYLAYFDGGQTLDPDYSYHKYGDNDEIIVRVYHEGQSDQQTLWFFRGWNQTSGDMAVPTELASYKPTNPSSAVYSANYPNGGTSQDGWIGFYNNNIRAWTQSLAQTTTGVMYGVVDIDGGQGQSLSYVDDPYVYIQDADATRRIYMNGREYAEFNDGGGSGGSTYVTLFDNQTTTNPSTITLNDDLTKYDQIQFQLRPTGTDAIFSMIYDVADLVVGDTIGAGSATNIFVWYYYTDTTTLTLRTSTSNTYMSKIVGIKHGTGGGSSSSGHDYSTNEQVVGTWIDGSTLYERTITLSSLGNVQSYVYSVASFDVSMVTKVEALVKLGSDGANQWITSPYVENSAYRCDCHWQSSDNSIYIKSNWGMTDAYVTIQYTKTP